MSRRKKVKDEFDEVVEEAEVVMRWSPARIVLATFLAIVIIAGGLYALTLMNQDPSRQVMGEKIQEPQIKIPTDHSVEEVINKAKEDLSQINAKNIISSQPKLQQIINDLTNLTGSSSSAKDLICNTVCK